LTGEIKDVLLLDITSHNLGIKAFSSKEKHFFPMINEGTFIPTKVSAVFLSKEDYEYVNNFNKRENERLKTNTFTNFMKFEFIKPLSISTQKLQIFKIDIVESDRKHEKVLVSLYLNDVPFFEDKPNEIKITFEIDANGKLHVSVLDKHSHRKEELILDVSTNLDETEYFSLRNKFEMIEKSKKEFKYQENLIKSAELTLHQSDRQLFFLQDKISIDGKNKIFSILDDLKKSILDKDVNQIDNIINNLNDAWQYISQELYLNSQDMKTNNKLIRIFISYAHDDNEKGLVDLFCKELEKQLKALDLLYNFVIFKDDKILMGEDWNQRLQMEVSSADVAILLLSSSFLTSDYISQNELARFLEKNQNRKSQILCPVYFDPFDFSKYQVIKRYQFFKPKADKYGPYYAHIKDDLCYGDLVDFDPLSGLPQPNRNRSRYMVDL
jgi:hypothetical protein